MTPLRFTLDPVRSCIWVDARSSLHPITTQTRGLHGWVELTLGPDGAPDLRQPVEGHLEVEVRRFSSGNQLYDRELMRRIDAKHHPLIVGKITGVATTASEASYHVTGDLSFHGVTRSFAHDMTIEVQNESALALKGERVFDIREFRMKPPSMLMVKVYPEVAVRVELYGAVER
jgi:polyisoprenoid-binding protein YceI